MYKYACIDVILNVLHVTVQIGIWPVVETVRGSEDPSIIQHRSATYKTLVGDRYKPKEFFGDNFSVQTDQPRPFSISRHFPANHAFLSWQAIA